MTFDTTPRSTKVLWALVFISLTYNTYDFLSSNEVMSQQLNLNRIQAGAHDQLRTDLHNLDSRVYDLEDQLDDLERLLEENINDLEWDLSVLRSELEDHKWYDH